MSMTARENCGCNHTGRGMRLIMEKTVSMNGERFPLDATSIDRISRGIENEGCIRILPNYIRSDILMYLSTSFLAFKKAGSDSSPLYIHSLAGESPASVRVDDAGRDTMIPSDAVIGRLKTKIKTILENIVTDSAIDEFDRIAPVRETEGITVYANDRYTVMKRSTSDTVPLYIRLD